VQSDGRSDVDKTPINLVGHSRGGAACIYVAPELHKQDIPVHSTTPRAFRPTSATACI